MKIYFYLVTLVLISCSNFANKDITPPNCKTVEIITSKNNVNPIIGFYKQKSEFWLNYKYINYNATYNSYNKLTSNLYIVNLDSNVCSVEGVILEGQWKSFNRFVSSDGTLTVTADVVTLEKNGDKITYSNILFR